MVACLIKSRCNRDQKSVYPLERVARILSKPSKECRLTGPIGLFTGKAVLESKAQIDSKRSVLSTRQSTFT